MAKGKAVSTIGARIQGFKHGDTEQPTEFTENGKIISVNFVGCSVSPCLCHIYRSLGG